MNIYTILCAKRNKPLDGSFYSDYAVSMNDGKSSRRLVLEAFIRRISQKPGGVFKAFLLFFSPGLAVLLFPVRMSAQESPPGAIFAPFISRLSAEVKSPFVRLSWIDSPDIKGTVYIYRSNTPITAEWAAANAAVIEAPYGVQSYIDEIETSGTIYYYIAASDEAGQKYNLVLPYNNSISVTIGEGEGGSALLTEAVRSAEQSIPQEQIPADTGISGLEAAVQGNRVIISYRNTNGAKSAILYRSGTPIRQRSDLLRAVIVQSGISPPIADYPVPGIPYYYAVIFEEDLTRGNVRIVPGANATVQAVSIRDTENRFGLPGMEGRQEGIRAMPLPLISLYAAAPTINSTGEIPQPALLGAEAVKAIAGIKAPEPNAGLPLKKPRAFNQDLEIPAGGEEYTLRSIVQDSFVKRDWIKARDELIRFLSLPRSSASESRARFYLGQAYYFSELYRESLFEFLLVEAQYPQEAAEWIQAVLARLVK
ncbi:MAG: hypothetical protein LBQ88_23695 [Treponema sp.]|jgi:hypothetical protein|nr:hypothetical protein [Treponema sp.]